MKKNLFNILLFLFVLAVPFAISSQTRKAIPAGRYEALSGIKVSHSSKKDLNSNQSAQSSFWNEVGKNLPTDKNEVYYISHLKEDLNISSFIPNKTFKNSTRSDYQADVTIIEDLQKDFDSVRKIKSKKLLIVLNSLELKEVISKIPNFEPLYFQSIEKKNYFLFKAK